MRITRSTGAASGLAIMLLGVWGALIPFVGPYFDYSFGANTSWHYTTDRLWLNILPGVVAFLGGLILVLARTRPTAVLGGWLALIAGAWFVLGPAVSLTWETGPGPIGRPLFGSTRQMLELIGYFYGLGAAIVALSAFVLGRLAPRPRLAEDAGAVAAGAGAVGAGQAYTRRGEPAAAPASDAEQARTAAPERRAGVAAGEQAGERRERRHLRFPRRRGRTPT
jgi:hypothetical protein